jgi:TfoX/Sxy family transcriptional regulator of competence genes
VAVDQELITLLRTHLASVESLPDEDTLEERRVVGGTGFFWRGNLLCGVMGADLLVRIAKADYGDVMGQDDVRPMEMGGRSSRSWLLVPKSAAGDTDVMTRWVERSIRYVGSLPTK